MYFADKNTSWGFEENGTILHTTNCSESFVKEEEIDETVTVYVLTQNYLNPFNPITTIKYQIPEMSFITIKIYDVLGYEISIIVNKDKPAGKYYIEFSVNGLTSGVYFYKLYSNNFTQTKK